MEVHIKRILLVFLAAVMLFSVFACTKNEGKKPADTTSPVTTPGATTEQTTEAITTTQDPDSPYIDDITLEGAKFRIAAREMYLAEEVFVSEDSTDPREQALWERNAAVQDMYDVKIEPFTSYDTTVGGHSQELSEYILADDDLFDIALPFAIICEQFVVKGLTINWNTLDYTDFTKPYWNDSVNVNLVIEDAIYTPVGDMWPFAFDIPIITSDPDTVLKFALGTEKAANAVNKINELYWTTNGSYCTDHAADTVQVHPLKFARGEALFTTAWMRQCFEIFADMSDQYSIIPYPMYDETQDKYRTSAADRYSVIIIPRTCQDRDMVSIVTEALNYEANKRVIPVYYEESLQKRYTHDLESIEMLDIIMEGRTFDISTILMYEISWTFRHVIAEKNKNFKTWCDRRATWNATVIGRVVEEYRNNKQL